MASVTNYKEQPVAMELHRIEMVDNMVVERLEFLISKKENFISNFLKTQKENRDFYLVALVVVTIPN